MPYVFIDYASVDAPPESGKSYYPFTDPSGLPVRIEDAHGEAVWTAHHTDPYGAITLRPLPHYRQSEAVEYRLRWPGHYFDPELGLHLNRYRDYDPTLGRFIEPDPLGHAGGINLYAYCRDPIGDVDLLGLHDQNRANATEAAQGRPATEGDGNARVRPVTARNARRGEQLDLVGTRADGWAGVVDGDWRRIGAGDGDATPRREHGDAGALRRELARAGHPNTDYGGGYDAHHIIPASVDRDHPLTQRGRELEVRGRVREPGDASSQTDGVDRANNGIMLPGSRDFAPEDGHALPIHTGLGERDHREYNERVSAALDRRQQRLEAEYGSLEAAPPAAIEGAIREVEDGVRRTIERDGGGRHLNDLTEIDDV